MRGGLKIMRELIIKVQWVNFTKLYSIPYRKKKNIIIQYWEFRPSFILLIAGQ